MKKISSITYLQTKTIAVAQKNNHSTYDISTGFDQIRCIMRKKKITEFDFWKINKIGSRIGFGIAQFLSFSAGMKPLDCMILRTVTESLQLDISASLIK